VRSRPRFDDRCREGRQSISAVIVTASPDGFADSLRRFTCDGTPTVEFETAGLRYFVNAFWTAAQRRGHSLHEVSYRACFKSQLPAFFIDRLTAPGDRVYDPFSGRGTTAVQTALMGRAPAANDVNPLIAMLSGPRFDPPPISTVRDRLVEIDLSHATDDPKDSDLLAFYHPDTLRQINALRARLRTRNHPVDAWIRMVALNRLTGHSPGFFSSSSHYGPAHLAQYHALAFWCLTVPEAAVGRTP
jgi:hypothetical protein